MALGILGRHRAPGHIGWGDLGDATAGAPSPGVQSDELVDRAWRPNVLPPRSSLETRLSEAGFNHPAAMVRIHDVIRAWRAAERELAAVPEGDPASIRLETLVRDLRALHHLLFAERIDRSEASIEVEISG